MAAERTPAVIPSAETLREGADYYLDAQGRYVFTAHYNRRRGHCCFQGCRHCPYGQAGRSREAAQADLARRLVDLQARLDAQAVPVTVRRYRNGVLLATRPRQGTPREARETAEAVRGLAADLLTVQQVEWG